MTPSTWFSGIRRFAIAYSPALFLLTFSAPAVSNSSQNAFLVPVTQLLLEDSNPAVLLIIGRPLNRVITGAEFAGGLEIQFYNTADELTLELTMGGIVGPTQLIINDVVVGDLVNGENTFRLSPPLLTSENTIRIVANDDSFEVLNASLVIVDGPTTLAEAQRFLMRATMGPNKREMERVLEVGYENWIDEQFSTPVTSAVATFDRINQQRIARRNFDFQQSGLPGPYLPILSAEQRFKTRMDAWWENTLFAPDQLRQRVTHAFSQIFNVTETTPEAIPPFQDVIAEHAFGNYLDMLKEITLSPQMGLYLSMAGNQQATGGEFPRVPDENYAREIMQLFSIGLVELNQDGSPKLENGNEIPTYNQRTVKEFARVFTGWDTDPPNRLGSNGWELRPMVPNLIPMIPIPGIVEQNTPRHDFGSKTLLNGHINPANLSIEEDLDQALRNIFEHDNVAPFICFRLIQRLVKSNPTPGYVLRVSQVFNNNGQGQRGDLKAVIKAILLDNEALEGHLEPMGGKMKEPILAVSQLWRAFNARSGVEIFRYSQPGRELGIQPLSAPTVFGFYEPTFVPQGPFEDANTLAPEINLITDNVVNSTLNRMAQLVSNNPEDSLLPTEFRPANSGVLVTFNNYRTRDPIFVEFNLTEITSAASKANQNAGPLSLDALRAVERDAIIEFLNERLLGGLMSSHLQQVLRDFTSSLNPDLTANALTGELIPDLTRGLQPRSEAALRDLVIREAIRVVAMSPEFMTQR